MTGENIMKRTISMLLSVVLLLGIGTTFASSFTIPVTIRVHNDIDEADEPQIAIGYTADAALVPYITANGNRTDDQWNDGMIIKPHTVGQIVVKNSDPNFINGYINGNFIVLFGESTPHSGAGGTDVYFPISVGGYGEIKVHHDILIYSMMHFKVSAVWDDDYTADMYISSVS